MKKKCITQFLAFLTAALTCISACPLILTGNTNFNVPSTEELKIMQDLENPESGEKEPDISPQSDKGDNIDKINPEDTN